MMNSYSLVATEAFVTRCDRAARLQSRKMANCCNCCECSESRSPSITENGFDKGK
jgi:hypothetical protein